MDIMNAFGITALTDEEKAELTEGPLTERRILSAKERKAERAKGKAETQINNVQSLMRNLKLSFNEAAGLLSIPESEQKVILKLMQSRA